MSWPMDILTSACVPLWGLLDEYQLNLVTANEKFFMLPDRLFYHYS